MDPDAPAWPPLPRSEVVKAVERKAPRRIPLVLAKWWGEGWAEAHGERLAEFDRYPDDCAFLQVPVLDVHRMNLSWTLPAGGAHDARVVIDDWAKLDEFIAKLPDPARDYDWDGLGRAAAGARAADRYVLLMCWHLFFERPWALRGMENLLADYYEHPGEVHRLHEALCALYCGIIREAAARGLADGFWASDDLGHQRQPMMSPATFRDLLFPYYRRVGAALRDCGMHFWLHSCGNNAPLMDDLIEAGVDVFHPVQKHTMDEEDTARRFGGRLAFLAGMDVQHALRERDPEGVRAEVRFLIDTFDGPGGGMCIAAGNGILPGTPLGNVHAFLDEALRYGTAHRELHHAGARARQRPPRSRDPGVRGRAGS